MVFKKYTNMVLFCFLFFRGFKTPKSVYTRQLETKPSNAAGKDSYETFRIAHSALNDPKDRKHDSE